MLLQHRRLLGPRAGRRERRPRSLIIIDGSERPGEAESDLVAQVRMDFNAHAHTQTTLRGGQREVYRVTQSRSPLTLPGREAPYDFEPERARRFPLAGWVHLDPVYGEVAVRSARSAGSRADPFCPARQGYPSRQRDRKLRSSGADADSSSLSRRQSAPRAGAGSLLVKLSSATSARAQRELHSGSRL